VRYDKLQDIFSIISCLAPHTHFSESEVFYILDHLQPTATGLDHIPAWFLRLIAPVFSTKLDSFHEDHGFQISPSLREDQKYEALTMLYRYRHVFARDVTEIKACKRPPLKIRLHTDRKMVKRQFKLNEADKAEILRQVKQMEDADVIERADSPWYNSPAYLVSKKSGQKRLLIDLSGINSLIIPKLV